MSESNDDRPSGGQPPSSRKVSLIDQDAYEVIIDALELKDHQKLAIRQHWLNQLLWWDKRARHCKRWYFALRGVVVVSGVLIPVLSGLSLGGSADTVFRILAAVLGAVVAGAAAWEGVAHHGDTWRDKRRAVELLREEGWTFFDLSGPYRGSSHKDVYPEFSNRTSKLITEEFTRYLDRYEENSGRKQSTTTQRP